MDDIGLLKLENDGLRASIQRLQDELSIAKKTLELILQAIEISQNTKKVTAKNLQVAQMIFGA